VKLRVVQGRSSNHYNRFSPLQNFTTTVFHKFKRSIGVNMIAVQNYIQLIAIAVFFGVLISKWVFSKSLEKKLLQSALIFITVLTFLWIKIDGASLAMCVRGFTGDLSVTTLLWIALAALSAMTKIEINYKPSSLQLVLMVILGGLLYLTTFGIIPFDLYYFGYDYVYIASVLFVWAILNYKWSVVPTIVVIAIMIAFQVSLLGSRNLFDYVVDLPVWLVVLWMLVRRFKVNGERLKASGER